MVRLMETISNVKKYSRKKNKPTKRLQLILNLVSLLTGQYGHRTSYMLCSIRPNNALKYIVIAKGIHMKSYHKLNARKALQKQITNLFN